MTPYNGAQNYVQQGAQPPVPGGAAGGTSLAPHRSTMSSIQVRASAPAWNVARIVCGTATSDNIPSVQAFLGPNLIFAVMVPYWVATGLQDTHFKVRQHVTLCGWMAYAP